MRGSATIDWENELMIDRFKPWVLTSLVVPGNAIRQWEAAIGLTVRLGG